MIQPVASRQAKQSSNVKIRDRIKELRRMKAKDLVPHPHNWRQHPEAQSAAIRGLLTEIGYANALIGRELRDGRIELIDGHLRAATAAPDHEVPVLVLDVTDAEAAKLLLTLDSLGMMAQPDAARISELLETVRTENPAVEELLRRTAGEVVWRTIHSEEIQEAEVPPDRADALQKKWGTALGQQWQIGPHRLLCGDSRERRRLERLEINYGFRLIVTDPP